MHLRLRRCVGGGERLFLKCCPSVTIGQAWNVSNSPLDMDCKGQDHSSRPCEYGHLSQLNRRANGRRILGHSWPAIGFRLGRPPEAAQLVSFRPPSWSWSRYGQSHHYVSPESSRNPYITEDSVPVIHADQSSIHEPAFEVHVKIHS